MKDHHPIPAAALCFLNGAGKQVPVGAGAGETRSRGSMSAQSCHTAEPIEQPLGLLWCASQAVPWCLAFAFDVFFACGKHQL